MAADDSHAGRVAAQAHLAGEQDESPTADDETAQGVRQAVRRAEDLADDLAMPATGRAMDETCHACPRHLSPITGEHCAGRSERVGVCPACRTRGVGTTAIVRIDGHGSTRTNRRLTKRQQGATPQSVSDAAAFIDATAPRGRYELRRVRPDVIEVRLPTADMAARHQLAERYKAARRMGRKTWVVQSTRDRIRLVDHGLNRPPRGDEGHTIRGP